MELKVAIEGKNINSECGLSEEKMEVARKIWRGLNVLEVPKNIFTDVYGLFESELERRKASDVYEWFLNISMRILEYNLDHEKRSSEDILELVKDHVYDFVTSKEKDTRSIKSVPYYPDDLLGLLRKKLETESIKYKSAEDFDIKLDVTDEDLVVKYLGTISEVSAGIIQSVYFLTQCRVVGKNNSSKTGEETILIDDYFGAISEMVERILINEGGEVAKRIEVGLRRIPEVREQYNKALTFGILTDEGTARIYK